MRKIGLVVGDEKTLEEIFNIIQKEKFTAIGPKIVDGIIKYDKLERYDELPKNVTDIQRPGYYKLDEGKYYRHGFDSPKKILFPPELEIFKVNKDLTINFKEIPKIKIAFFGIKPCDVASIRIMDKILIAHGDSYYSELRKNIMIITENCVEPGNTCFCASLGTGPRAKEGFDIAYTKIDEKIIFEADSDKGVELLEKLKLPHADKETKIKFIETMEKAANNAKADFTSENLSEKLELTIGSKIYEEIAEKCLGCGNCTMVCPTCFCFDIYDKVYLDEYVKRVRYWDSCFTYKHAEVAGGHFRPELWARYRQWLLHKFSYWKRQFDILGCVGCGRCITWCPVGIDIRESVKKALNWVKVNVG